MFKKKINFMKNIFNKTCYFLAIGFGSGLFYYMPGTIGSIVASFIWGFITFIFPLKRQQLLIIILAFILGIYICKIASIHIKKYDHKSIVWDEFVGMWLIITMLPNLNWRWFTLGLFLFRIIDIIKPIPINYFHKSIKGGLGIMLDDLFASFLTLGILYFLNFIIDITIFEFVKKYLHYLNVIHV